MRKTKILIGILIFCILANFVYLDTLSGIILMISHFLLLFGLIINYHKASDVFSPMSVVYIGLIISFSIKGIYILAVEKFDAEMLILPLIYYIIFIGFFTFGLCVKPSKKLPKIYTNLASREVKYNKVGILSIVATLIGFGLFIFKIGSTDLTYLVSNLLNNRRLFQNNGGLYFQTLVLLLIQTALYINVILYYKNRIKSKRNLRIAIILFINLFITFTLGGRGMIIGPIIAIFFYKFKITRQVDWKKIIIFGIIFVIFSGWYGLFRDGLTTSYSSFKELEIGNFIKNILDRYVQFDNFIRLVQNPVDFTFGKSFIDFILSPIPRSILPTKAYNFNSQMTQIYHPAQFGNLIVTDFTMLSELILNFGTLGLVFGGFIFGILISYFNKLYIYSDNTFFYFWYPFMMFKPMSILYGGMINSTVNMMIILETPILIILWSVYSKKIKKTNNKKYSTD